LVVLLPTRRSEMGPRFRRTTSAIRAFYIQVAVPMRLPDAGRRMGSSLPEAGLANVTSAAPQSIVSGPNRLRAVFWQRAASC
jgi:hypothetical protein